jgi:Family of unknown function (DUF6326)
MTTTTPAAHAASPGPDPTSAAPTASDRPSTADRRAPGVEPLDRRIVISGLWVTMLFVFAYVDIFGFWRDDVIRGALAGTVPGVGFTIGQPFLALTTLYVLVPILMVVGSLVLPWRANRTAHVVLPLVYAVTVVASMVGETWVYYLVGSGVEIVLLLAIAWTARRWR